MDVLSRYAHLLVHYCLELQPGEKLYITSTTLAEPLVREVLREATRAGGIVEYDLTIREHNRISINEANDTQLSFVNPHMRTIIETYDAYLTIRAPFNLKEDMDIDGRKAAIRSSAMSHINQIYFERIADRDLKRCLCQYPTLASAQQANMSLEEYENFVYNACNLYADDPAQEWRNLSKIQQVIVDRLNKIKEIRYITRDTDITFSVDGRTWINSDGKSNMPSGEVYSGPVENSVNGHIRFSYPSVYGGHEFKNVYLEVSNGVVVKATADVGEVQLQQILSEPGANMFGEVAIGTNYKIHKATGNILFDEKIGGSVHMALGQSYKQTGGLNTSSVHWDLITDMKDGGQIYGDGVLIYKDGKFIW
jgi:aminopeptidase